eukprot:Lankesteria_metandrocarpae@DN1142_c0_g1_i1.p1
MSERRMSLLVRNLRYETSPERVRRHFEQFGDVRDVYLPLHYHTKKPRGFGFVEFFDEREARDCLKHLHRSTLDGNEISVTLAQQGRKSPDTMRHRDRRQEDDEDGDSGGGGRRYSSRSRSPDRAGGGLHRRRGNSRDRGHRHGDGDSRVSRHGGDRGSRDRYAMQNDERSRSRSFDRYDSGGYRRRDGGGRNDRRRRDVSDSPPHSRRYGGGRGADGSSASRNHSRHKNNGRMRSPPRGDRAAPDTTHPQEDAPAHHADGGGKLSERSASCSPAVDNTRTYDSRTGSPSRTVEEGSDAGTGNYDGEGRRGSLPLSRSRSPVVDREEYDGDGEPVRDGELVRDGEPVRDGELVRDGEPVRD